MITNEIAFTLWIGGYRLGKGAYGKGKGATRARPHGARRGDSPSPAGEIRHRGHASLSCAKKMKRNTLLPEDKAENSPPLSCNRPPALAAFRAR